MQKKIWVTGAIVLLLLVGCKETPSTTGNVTGDSSAKNVALDSQERKVSYAVGLDIGSSFERNGAGLNLNALLMGVSDGLEQKEPRLNAEEIGQAIMTFQQQIQTKQMERLETLITEQKKASADFLAEFSRKPGVVVLDSGLMYLVEQEGSGAQPSNSDMVKVHYRGTTVDGTEFDSSYERGEPVEFQVDRVIAGWTEALQLMKEGSKWQLAIPAELAYGEHGRSGVIPPEAALIFDVELLEVSPVQE
ncbi:MAG: FKBP-type peptidyl-prolyl cis-trans isomerase [Desulfuromonadaceae bacterium]|nr:FKBP-type peptidyl-prolyl cis-trans isomerase [Desulfuromonadaceae bacterium]